MSMPDITDELLLGDDDELDYDLQKEDEEALLADPNECNDDDLDDENYDDENNGETVAEETEDVLDLGVGENLDETDDYQTHNNTHIKQENYKDYHGNYQNQSNEHVKQESEDYQSDHDENSSRRENRFSNERNNVTNVKYSATNSVIPDSLDNIPVNNVNSMQNNNQKFNNRGNGRFRGNNRGRGRGRGIPNINNMNRGSVFNRIGNVPKDNKTVLINPHFRGNVHINSQARLVWDATQNPQNPQYQQHYQGVPPGQGLNQNIGSVPPHQNVPVWENPPFQMQQQNPIQPLYNQNIQPIQSIVTQPPQIQHQQMQPQIMYHEQQQPPMGPGMGGGHMPFNQPVQGNFRGREIQYIPGQPQPLIPPHQNQFINPQNQQFHPPNQQYHPQNQQFYPPNYRQDNFNQMPPMNQQNPNQMHQIQSLIPQQQPLPLVQNQNPHYQNNYGHNQYNKNFNRQQSNDGNQMNRNFKNENNRQFFKNENKQGYHQNNQNQQLQRTPPKRRSFENQSTPSTDYDSPKKKKRSMEFGNLHEVKIVDLPDSTNKEEKSPEYEDEETKAYRIKIEEQKRLREQLLQKKEARRKLIAINQNEVESTSDDFKEIVKKATIIQKKIVAKPNNILIKTTNNKNQIQNKVQNQKNQNQNQQRQQIQKNFQKPQQFQQTFKNPNQRQRFMNQNRVIQNVAVVQKNPKILQKTTPNIVITQKNNLGSPISTQSQSQSQSRRIVLASSSSNSKTVTSNSNRRVVLNSSELINSEKPLSSEFLLNRKVVETTTTLNNLQGVLIKTPVVTVSNLAVTTTDDKLRKLCQGLGPVKTIEMKPSSREATIQFQNVLSAHKFFKKYQRKIIDLSMIQVTLVQPEKS